MGATDLYIDEAHTALDIFRFAVFFFDVFVFGKDWIRNKKDNNENLCFSVGEVLDN